MLGARVHVATKVPRTATIHVTAACVESQEAPAGRAAARRGALVSPLLLQQQRCGPWVLSLWVLQMMPERRSYLAQRPP